MGSQVASKYETAIQAVTLLSYCGVDKRLVAGVCCGLKLVSTANSGSRGIQWILANTLHPFDAIGTGVCYTGYVR